MTRFPNPAIVAILAGGKARRFGGQDKGEIQITGRRLIEIIHERLTPQFTDIIISGPHDYGLGLDVVPDVSDAPGGPVGGIYSLWKHFEGGDIEGFFTAAIDGPNLPADLAAQLYSGDTSTIAADEVNLHPTYGWWRMGDLKRVWSDMDISQSISLKRLASLAEAKDVRWAGRETFTNINSSEDMKTFL